MIGNSRSLFIYHDFLKFIQDACDHDKLQGTLCARTIKKIKNLSWKDKIPDALFRPGLSEFFQTCRELFPTVEFFIYSAGEQTYIETMVRILEQRMNVTFNRPLLNRTDAIVNEEQQYKKTIQHHFPMLLKTLSKKYKKDKKDKKDPIDIDHILNHRWLFIDDRNTIWDDKDKDHFIPCPEYTYVPLFQMHDVILDALPHTPLLMDYLNTLAKTSSDASSMCLPHGIDITTTTLSKDAFQMYYHIFMTNVYQTHMSNNERCLKDTFFMSLLKCLKPLAKQARPFSAKNINRIRKVLK